VRALKTDLVALNSTTTHYHANQNILKASEIWTWPPYSGHAVVVLMVYGVHIGGAPLCFEIACTPQITINGHVHEKYIRLQY